MPKKLSVTTSILCDYVGKGNANKHTLVNVIAGDVLVASLPANVSFGFFFEFQVGGLTAASLTLEAVIGGKEIFRAVAQGMPHGGTASGSSVVVIPFVSFSLEADADLEVYASVEGFDRTRIMKRRISKGDLSTAFRPPSEQSPSAVPDSSSQP